MKKIVGLWVHLLIVVCPAFSQVDTSYIYNTSMPYGTLDLRLAKSDTRYYYLQEDVTFSFRESAPGVKTNTYRDMTSWNSEPYRQGNMRERNGAQDQFVMNYRLLFPNNYNANYDPGYPIIIMLHGYGERGNCWFNNCYWSTTGWNPNTNSPPAPTSSTHNLLNNDHNLLHGGLKHLDAVKLAGNRLPDDPSMPNKAFPGFVLFPQVLNGWQYSARVEDAIKLLRLVIKKYNIDENRVYIHALSNGGGGLYQAVKRAPWLFAAALPMSAVSNGGIFNDGIEQEVGKIPWWIFQGGKDTNPTPSRTYHTVKGLREAGASVRYSLYPHLGHGTWNTAYNEPEFFPWILSKRKNNPHVYYGNPVICNTNGVGVRISFSNGFRAYQWQHDGVIIPGANQSQYIANTPGTYRGRFSRVPNPSENDWEPWSDEIVVTEISPAKPAITALGTTHLRGPGLAANNPNNTVELKSDSEAELYLWYKDGVQINFPGTDVNDTLRTASFTSAGTGANGVYTLRTSYSFCPSPPSDPVHLFFANSAPQNMTFDAASAEFKGVPMNDGIFLTWNDLVASESGYEIWRRKAGDAEFKFAGRAPKNSISFFDRSLEPSSSFEYKIRAVGNAGVSNYVPSNDLSVNLIVNTPADVEKPQPPQDLQMVVNTINSFTLSWKAPSDNTGISGYIVTYGGTTVNTNSASNTFTVTNLPPNTTYPVTVKAIDHAGNISEASNQVIGSTYVLGLFYKHSTGGWEDLDDPTMVETWTNPEFTGKVSNVTLAPRTQEDFFNFEFSGYIDILTAGQYIFRLTSNDGSRLFIDDALSIENNGVHGNVTKFDTLTLTAGPHRLKLHYFDYAGSHTLTLQYKGPDLTAGFKPIPDSLFRSGKYIAPPPPAVPSGLAATGSGMERVDITWANAGNAVEIYKSISASGPFVIAGTSNTGTFADTISVNPGTTYYYKARALSSGAMSDFTAVVNATTQADAVAPTVPTNISLANKSHTNAALTWSPSSDNAELKGYEIYVNGVLSGTSEIPAYMVSNLDPGSSYTITVVAVDMSNNKSAASAGLALTTNAAATYYSLATGNLNQLSTWKQFPNGTGSSPANFGDNGLVFIVSNRTSTGLGGAWDVSGSASKIIVPAGVTLNVDNVLNGTLETEGNAVVNISNASIPSFGKLSAASTINFTLPATIPARSYGNVVVSGAGTSTFDSGTTTILGNLSVGGASVLKGAAANASRVVVGGNIAQQTTGALVAADNRINFIFTDNAAHTVTTASNFFAYYLNAGTNSSLTFVPSANPVRVVTGSLNGGGLLLNTGATLNVGANSLEVVGAGSVNPGTETGVIQISSGDFRLISGSTATSNLFFHSANNLVDSLTVELSAGQVAVRSAVVIEGALIIRKGTINGGGLVTLKASESKTASLAEIGEGGAYAGNLRVQKFIPHIQNQRAEMSATVSGVTVANWQTYFPVTGAFAGASGGSTEPSLFTFNGTALTPYPPAGGSNSAPIEKGRGYQAMISNTSSVVMETVGVPHQGAVTIPLTGNASGSADAGWNLVGNPYASAILWSDSSAAFTKTDVANTIAVRENKVVDGQLVAQYHYHSRDLGSATIPAGGAFWLRALSGTPSLIIHERAKAAMSAARVSADAEYLRVTLKQNSNTDHTYILFHANATDAFDPLYDFPKRGNEGMFGLGTISNGTTLAVNALAANFCSTSVALAISGAGEGSYALAFAGLESIADIGHVVLKDAYTNATVPLTSDYAFSISADAASYAADRFTITFSRSQLDVTTPQAVGQPVCSDSPALVIISNSQAEVEYAVMNAAQDVISEVVIGNGEDITLQIPVEKLSNGENPVTIRAAFPGCVASTLQSVATVNYTQGFDVVAQDDVSICLGEQGTLTASGVPEGGSYRWYDALGEVIPGQTGNTIETSTINAETLYQVSGVLSNGCESARKTIHVYADTLAIPVIIMYRDTLVTQVDGSFQWYRNGNVIPGATDSYLAPGQTGDYYVIVSSSGCSKQSAPYTHIVDPGCTIDTSVSDVALENNECGPESYVITVSNSLPEIAYSVINSNNELISASVPGNNGVLMLALASSALDSGLNHIRIRVEKENCINRTLDRELDINNLAPLTVSLPDTVVTCLSGTAELSVAVAEEITGYQWFDADQFPIEGATGQTFTTGAITEPTAYYVNAMHTSGCASVMEKVVVVPAAMNPPVITESGGVLLVDNAGEIQWFHEGQPVEGATSGELRANKSGNYTVRVTQDGCESMSAPFAFVLTSVADADSEFQLHAYPSPGTSKEVGIRLHTPEYGPVLVQVVDMTGRILIKKWFEPGELMSKVLLGNDLKNGLYNVIASQGSKEVRKRIVIRN